MTDPVVAFDPITNVVTIDGYRFARDYFHHMTASPLGVSFRIVSRADGVLTVETDWKSA